MTKVNDLQQAKAKVEEVFESKELFSNIESLTFDESVFFHIKNCVLEEQNTYVYSKNPKKIPKIKFLNNKKHKSKAKTIIICGYGYTPELEITIIGGGAIVYLADNTKFTQLRGKLTVNNEAVLLVGKGVSAWNLKMNISSPGAIIGDDVMIAHNVEIRTHSGHCFLDLATDEITTVNNRLVIEPHVWLGENSKVFKCTFIGACSVVGYRALVSIPVPRFSSVKDGSNSSRKMNKLWMRSPKLRDKEKAIYFYEKFINANARLDHE